MQVDSNGGEQADSEPSAPRGFAAFGPDLGPAVRTEKHQYKLFSYQVFYGQRQININEPVLIVWNDEDSERGSFLFGCAHHKTQADVGITFPFVEAAFVHTGDGQSRSALILRIRKSGNNRIFKLFFGDEVLQQTKYPILHRYITVFLNEVADANELRGVCMDINHRHMSIDRLRQLLNTEVHDKRIRQILYRHKHINESSNPFCDTIPAATFPNFLKFNGIRVLKQRGEQDNYEETVPDLSMTDVEMGMAAATITNEVPLSKPFVYPQQYQQQHHRRMHEDRRMHEETVGEFLGSKRRRAPALMDPSTIAPPPPPPHYVRTQPAQLPGRPVSESLPAPTPPPPVPPPPPSKPSVPFVPARKAPVKKEPELVALDDDDDETAKVSPTKKRRKNKLLEGKVELNFEDMRGVWHNEMVNDNIVDCYLNIVYRRSLTEEQRSRMHIFTCFFYKRLLEGVTPQVLNKSTAVAAQKRFAQIEKNYARVKRWTNKVDIFSKDYLILPVVEDMHWYLIVVVKPYLAVRTIDESAAKDPPSQNTVPDTVPGTADTTVPPAGLGTQRSESTSQDSSSASPSSQDSKASEENGGEKGGEEKRILRSEVDDPIRARIKGYTSKTPPATYVIICDSLVDAADYKRQAAVDMIRDYLELEFKAKKALHHGGTFERWRIAELRPIEVPQQRNYYDCGFFMLKFAEEIMLNPPTDLRRGVRWRDWYPHTKHSLDFQRELVLNTIRQEVNDPEVWREFEEFNSRKRNERDGDRKVAEVVEYARRHRHHSTCHYREEVRIRRSHSEPRNIAITPAAHFH